MIPGILHFLCDSRHSAIPEFCIFWSCYNIRRETQMKMAISRNSDEKETTLVMLMMKYKVIIMNQNKDDSLKNNTSNNNGIDNDRT